MKTERTPIVCAVLPSGLPANVAATCSLAEFRSHVERLLGRSLVAADETIYDGCVRRNRTASATADAIRNAR